MSEPRAAQEYACEWDEVARALFAAKGITSGLWRVAVQVNFSAFTGEMRAADSTEAKAMPSALVGMGGLVLQRATEPGLLVYDAAGSHKAPLMRRAIKRVAK